MAATSEDVLLPFLEIELVYIVLIIRSPIRQVL